MLTLMISAISSALIFLSAREYATAFFSSILPSSTPSRRRASISLHICSTPFSVSFSSCTSCSTHKKVSTILLYIYFTRKPVNIQDLYFPRRKGKILRLARSGRGLGQRPISAISVHIMSGRGARRESPSLFLRPAHRGSEGECTGEGAGQLFRSKCFRQSACGFMKDLWAGWLRGESLYPDEKRVNVRK